MLTRTTSRRVATPHKMELWWTACVLSLVSVASGGLPENVTVPSEDEPAWQLEAHHLEQILEDELRTTHWSLKIGKSSGLSDILPQSVWVRVESQDVWIAEVIQPSWQCLDVEPEVNFTVDLRGVFLGYAKLLTTLRPGYDLCSSGLPATEDDETFFFRASVVRALSPLVIGFTVVIVLFVSLNYINMGCQLEIEQVCKVLKTPMGPLIGFVCQFLFMPLAAYGIGYALLDDPSLRLGLFVLGCSPGGSMSNFWTLLFDGDLNLSVTMTFVSTVAALGMMPLWIFTLGSTLFQDRTVQLPYPNLAASLAGLTIPIGIGILIRRYKPGWAEISGKIIRPFTAFCIVVGSSVGLYANRYLFQLLTWRILLAGLSIAWGGYTFGGVAAWIARLPRSQIVAIAIETAFQNAGVAFVMLVLSLTQPEADLAAVPLVAQLILTGLPMWVILAGVKIRQRCCPPVADKDVTKTVV